MFHFFLFHKVDTYISFCFIKLTLISWLWFTATFPKAECFVENFIKYFLSFLLLAHLLFTEAEALPTAGLSLGLEGEDTMEFAMVDMEEKMETADE